MKYAKCNPYGIRLWQELQRMLKKHAVTGKDNGFIITSMAWLLAILLVVSVMPTVHANAADTGRTVNESNGYIFKLKKNMPETLSCMSVSGVKPIPYTDGLFTADNLADIQSYMGAGLVEYVEQNDVVRLSDTGMPLTSDPMLSDEWYADTLEIASAWDKGLDGDGVTVAVIDSGVNASHEDLAGAYISGYNFIGSDTAAYGTDSTGHGTFVSGIIAARKNNGKGLAGLTDRVNLLELRCFDSKTTSISNVVSAIAYAIGQKVDIINMSFGGTISSLANSLREQIDNAAAQGIIMVSAVGNGENDDVISLNYPAAFDNVIGVGMVDRTGAVDGHSQKNSSVFVTAPGVAMPGLGNSAADAYISSGTGTSYAAPVVTSLAAMAKQTNKAIDVEGFKKLLQACAVDDASGNGYDTSYGYGVVNARLMAEALSKDYNITYNLSGGTLNGTAGDDYPITYKLGRSADITLPMPVRSGYKFAGWYGNPTFTGNRITKVADSTVGDIQYYAKWFDEADTALSSVTVRGIAAEVDETNSNVYHVAMPSNHTGLSSSDISIIPLNSDALVSTPATSDNGNTWTFDVSMGDGNTTTYTLNVSESSFARPWAKGISPAGEAIPASCDGQTAAVSYSCPDVSVWFNDVNSETVYSIISDSGTGTAEIAGTKVTYTPSEEDEGKTVSLVIGAKNGPFDSTINETVSIEVKAVPVSNSVIDPATVTFDRILSPGDVDIKADLYGNSLVSVVNDTYALAEGTDYSLGLLPGIESQSAVVTIKSGYLRGLSDGTHKLTFMFNDGRSEEDKKVYLNINISTTTYTVTFINDDAVYATIPSIIPDAAVTLPADPKKNGCKFDGWFTGVDGSGLAFTALTRIKGNLTVYAKWSRQTYSEGGSAGNGISAAGSSIVPQPITTPSVVNASQAPYPPSTEPASVSIRFSAIASAPAENSIQVPYTLSDGEASVIIRPSTVSEISNKLEGDAVIDFSAVSGVNAINIEKSSLEDLTLSFRPGDKGITLLFPAGGITLSPDALSSILTDSAGQEIIFSLVNAGDSLSEVQKKSASGHPVYKAGITSGSKPVTAFTAPIVLEIPYTPKGSEMVEGIGAACLDDNGNLTALAASYDAETEKVYAQTSRFSEFVITYNEPFRLLFERDNPFSDVGTSDWYFDSVAYVYRKGFFSGLTDKLFAPDATMTRSMLITVLYRMAGQPEVVSSENFSDVVRGSWYEKAVNWALANKIVSGVGGNRFAPDNPITREQVAVILYNYNKSLQKINNAPSAKQAVLNNFLDKANVDLWAYEEMCWAIGNELISGKPGDMLNPENTATRAEVSAIFQRFSEKV